VRKVSQKKKQEGKAKKPVKKDASPPGDMEKVVAS